MKVWNYVILITILAMVFEFSGIPVATDLLNYVGISSTGLSLKTAGLYLAIFGSAGILIGLGVGLVVGFITKSQPENFIILPFIVGAMTLFTSIFVGIISQAFLYSSWIGVLTLLIMSPLAIGFVVALIEFFRGTD